MLCPICSFILQTSLPVLNDIKKYHCNASRMFSHSHFKLNAYENVRCIQEKNGNKIIEIHSKFKIIWLKLINKSVINFFCPLQLFKTISPVNSPLYFYIKFYISKFYKFSILPLQTRRGEVDLWASIIITRIIRVWIVICLWIHFKSATTHQRPICHHIETNQLIYIW